VRDEAERYVYQDKCVVLFDAPATSSRSAPSERESSAPDRLLAVAFAFFLFCKIVPEKGSQLSGEHCDGLVKQTSSFFL
jgi:hypothetical protein